MKPINIVVIDGIRWCGSCKAIIIDGHERDPLYHWTWCKEVPR